MVDRYIHVTYLLETFNINFIFINGLLQLLSVIINFKSALSIKRQQGRPCTNAGCATQLELHSKKELYGSKFLKIKWLI
jgi:hypothetical protein